MAVPCSAEAPPYRCPQPARWHVEFVGAEEAWDCCELHRVQVERLARAHGMAAPVVTRIMEQG